MTDIDIKEFMYSAFKNMNDTIKEIKDGLKENTALTEKTFIQATKTNGRVTALEDKVKDYSSLQVKVGWIIGVGTTFAVLGGIIYTFTVKSLNDHVDQKFIECCQKKTENSTTYNNNVNVK